MEEKGKGREEREEKGRVRGKEGKGKRRIKEVKGKERGKKQTR